MIARSVISKKHGGSCEQNWSDLRFKLDGNTLWMTLTNIIGDRVENPATVRLVRIEGGVS